MSLDEVQKTEEIDEPETMKSMARKTERRYAPMGGEMGQSLKEEREEVAGKARADGGQKKREKGKERAVEGGQNKGEELDGEQWPLKNRPSMPQKTGRYVRMEDLLRARDVEIGASPTTGHESAAAGEQVQLGIETAAPTVHRPCC